MDLDDFRHALNEAGDRRAPSDVSDARVRVGARAQRRRRRQRSLASATLMVGAIAVIIAVLAIAGGGGGERRHAPALSIPPAPSYERLPSRSSAAMAYDGARDRVVLFGGQDLSGAVGDTWTWDGHGWTAMHPSVSPPARTGAAMAYDPRTKAVLLFGGVAPRVHAATQAFDDTWSWNGTTWTRLQPQHEPPWGTGLAMSYDARSRSVILLTLPSSHPNLTLTPDGVGSRGDTPFGTWSWDGSDWRELPTPTAPLFAIGAVFHGDPHLTPLPDGAGLLLSSWAVYTGTCPPPGQCGGPADPTGTLDSQTWTWDGARWTHQSPHHAPVDGQLVATPGADAAPTVFTAAARWEWTGSDWRESRSRGPGTAIEGSAVYDEQHREVVAYGGRFGSDGAFFDTWTWDGSWHERAVGAASVPTTVPATVAATSPSSSTAPTTAPATSPAVRMCASSQLQLVLDRQLQSVMQQPGAYFALTNRAAVACTLDGYPTLTIFDAAGHRIPATMQRGSSYQINDPGARRVVLQPGASVYFGFGWTNANQSAGGSTQGCLSIASVTVVPPGAGASLHAAAHLDQVFCPPNGFVTALAPKDAFTPSHP